MTTFTAPTTGTFAELCSSMGIPYSAGSGYYELGSKQESISEGKELLALYCPTGESVAGGAAVRKRLGLGGGALKLKAAALPTGWRVFVQSTSPNRKVPGGTDFVVVVSGHGTQDVELYGTPRSTGTAPVSKRSRAAATEAGGTAAKRAGGGGGGGKQKGTFWKYRFERGAALDEFPGDAIQDEGCLPLVDGSGKPKPMSASYCDTEILSEYGVEKVHQAMDELRGVARERKWVPTMYAPDDLDADLKKDDDAAKWRLAMRLEGFPRLPAGAADDADSDDDDSVRYAKTSDGTYVEYWVKRSKWDRDMVAVAQLSPDHPLAVSCVGCHPGVQTKEFLFANSDGSSNWLLPELPSQGEHPLLLIALAETYLVAQVH